MAHYQTQVNKYIKIGYVNIYISYHQKIHGTIKHKGAIHFKQADMRS